MDSLLTCIVRAQCLHVQAGVLGHACSIPPPSVCGWEKPSRLWGSPPEHCECHCGPEFQACLHSGFRKRQ